MVVLRSSPATLVSSDGSHVPTWAWRALLPACALLSLEEVLEALPWGGAALRARLQGEVTPVTQLTGQSVYRWGDVLAALSGESRPERSNPDGSSQEASPRESGAPPATATAASLPIHLTVEETADLLRTTPKAIYSMVERDLLPGAFRLGSRVLIHRDDLLHSLDERRVPSPRRSRR